MSDQNIAPVINESTKPAGALRAQTVAASAAPIERSPVVSATRPRAPSAPNEEHAIGVLIADPEAIFRLGLQRLLATERGLAVVCEIDQPAEFISQAVHFQPDIIFVQHKMLEPDPSALLAALRQGTPSSKCVVTGSSISENEALALIKAGARGVILKSAEPALFVRCARKVAENEIWLPKRQVAEMARLLSEPGSRPADTLTNREKLVIGCLVQGWRNREIARHLSITEQTVKNHLRSVYDKVGVSDRVELVLYAIHHRLDLPSVGPGPAL